MTGSLQAHLSSVANTRPPRSEAMIPIICCNRSLPDRPLTTPIEDQLYGPSDVRWATRWRQDTHILLHRRSRRPRFRRVPSPSL